MAKDKGAKAGKAPKAGKEQPGRAGKGPKVKKAKVKGGLLDRVTDLVLVLFLVSLVAQQVVAQLARPPPERQASSPAAVRRSRAARSRASSARSTARAAACTAGRSGAPRLVRAARAAVFASRSSSSRAAASSARVASTASRWRDRSSRSARVRHRPPSCYGGVAPVHAAGNALSGWRNWQTR